MAASADKQVLYDMIRFKEIYDYPVFVETGTSNGVSTLHFAEHFEKVYTCDNSLEHQRSRELNFEPYPKIKFMLGDSKDCLPTFFNEVGNDKFFLFLDAHGSSWPILDELQIVADFGYKPFIFIHDFDCKHEGWRFDCWGVNPNIDKNTLDPKEWWLSYEFQLGYDYVKPKMDLIYGEGNYGYWLSETSLNPLDAQGFENFRGFGFFYPNL